jgi:alpha-D-xyloside xylohydrolase
MALAVGIPFASVHAADNASAVESSASALSVASYKADANGVTFTLNKGVTRVVVCQEDIIRVEYSPASSIPTKTSLVVNKVWGKPKFKVKEDAGIVTLTTSRIKVKVNKSTGAITYTDLQDNVILAEHSSNSKSVTPFAENEVKTNRIETRFESPADEALFGLGQHQDNILNRKGTRRHILNGNTEINVPVLVSNKGYGLYWDNTSESEFYGDLQNNTEYSYASRCGDAVDYYFFYGPSIDKVVSLYRTATGAAPLFPKWAYGLFQSKDKYESQAELLKVKDGYRDNKIPVDCIVQDWDYWSPYAWGSHILDPARYPDPAGLLSEFHKANIHGMISVWPVYQSAPTPPKNGEEKNFNELNALGALYPSGGTHHFYDTFNEKARSLVFKQINEELLEKYGWDGIWADNTEPQAYPDPFDISTSDTALGKGILNINAYPLEHSRALYEGWRSIGPSDKRVYNLTRSAFAGQQRYATTCWSGDIQSDFPTLERQIPAGLDFAISGIPYWTTDIGGYWGHRVNWKTPEHNELFTRWFEYGAFCPIFRVHGGGTRELYSDSWTDTTKATLLKFDNLRYRLMPYIYSLGWKVTNSGYTIMRPLVFDYQNDPQVFNIKDQFLFGSAFLVNPIDAAGVTSRSVYFPSGTWYDFWTGETVEGGQTKTVDAPLSQIPVYVKAGSIIPMGPFIQYAEQSVDPLEIRVYKGADGTFTLYEDEGDSYNYEKGKYSEIQFSWNNAAQQLTIGARKGSFNGILAHRTFQIVLVDANHGNGVEIGASDHTVDYNGSKVVVSVKAK